MNIRKILNSINELEFFLNVFDKLNGKIIRKNKYGEVFLEKFGLYKNKNSNDLTKSIIYILSCGERKNELIDLIIEKNLDIKIILEAVQVLKSHKIIKIQK